MKRKHLIPIFCTLFITLTLAYTDNLKAQVTIGDNVPPKPFSLLELHAKSNPGIKGGLRLPQIDNADQLNMRDSISKYPTEALGLIAYNTGSNTIEFWDGNDWIAAKAIEPWMESTTTNKASLNTHNIYQMGSVGIGTAATPAAKLEVVGDAIIHQMLTGTTTDSVVVIKNGLLKRVAQNTIIPANGNITSTDLDITNGTGAVLKNVTADIKTSGVTTTKLADGAVTTIKVANKAITPAKLVDGTAANQILKWNGTTWTLRPDTIVEPWQISGGIAKASANTDNIYQMGSVGIGTSNVPTAKLEVAGDAIIRLTTTGTTTDSVVVIKNGLLKRVAQNTIIPASGNITSTDLDITNGTGAALKNVTADIKALGVTTTKLADGAVTTIKVANKAITPAKIADGTAANQILKWNGTTWTLRPDTIVEPWQVTNSSTKASTNIQDIYQTGKVGIGQAIPAYQLDVNGTNATTDPLRILTLQGGTRTDSLVTINSAGLAKKRSIYGLRKDIITPETTAEPAFAGMTKYDVATKTMQYYDGTNWQIIASNALSTKNEGIVKINSGSGGTIPTFNNTNANTSYIVSYTTPLVYGISAWPENLTSATDANIYTGTGNNARFYENTIVNQTHIWRITVSYTKGNNIYSQQLDLSFFNPVSNFRVTSNGTIASSRTSGTITFYVITVADSNSIGNGYQMLWSCSDQLTKLTVDNVTRVSSYKD